MAYLDSHGLETLWTKIKASFARKVSNTTGDDSVVIKLQNASGGDIDAGSTTIAGATTTAAGVMSKADKSKLDGIEAGANKYVHPVTSGNKHIPSNGESGKILGWASDGTAAWVDAPDTGVTKIIAGSNVSVSPATGTGEVTVSATDTTYESKSASSGGTAVSLVTTGEKYTWNNKGTYSKPSGGIPKTDLASAVQTSLGKADTALQEHQSLSGYATETWVTGKGYQNSTQVNTAIETAMSGAAKYKGTIATEAAFIALTNYKQGEYWVASASFTHSTGATSITIDTGNMIFCNKNYASVYSYSDFDIIQADIEAIPDSVINALS